MQLVTYYMNIINGICHTHFCTNICIKNKNLKAKQRLAGQIEDDSIL